MKNDAHLALLANPTGHNMGVMAERLNHIINKLNVEEINTILDIGSMDGWESINLARIFNHAAVNCFEPVPSNFDICTNNVEAADPSVRDRISIHRTALNDVSGPMTFYAIDEEAAIKRGKVNRGMGSKYELMDPDMWPWEHNKQKPITVHGSTLTDWAHGAEISRVDGIWMDVQGAELDVLKGISPELFANIQFIITEAGIKPYYHGQSLKSQMDELLAEHGFVEWMPARQIAHEYEANVIYLNRRICNF